MFVFSFQADLSQPVPVEADSATVHAQFRHFASQAVRIGESGAAGALNLGYRLWRRGGKAVLFEDRAVFSRTSFAAGEWVPCRLVIPAHVIDVAHEYELCVDLLREQEFWFAEKGEPALRYGFRFCAPEHNFQAELDEIRATSLEDALTRAYARIAELEQSERALQAEREEYRVKHEVAQRRLDREVESIGVAPVPAAVAAELLRSSDLVRRRDRWLATLTGIGAEGALFALYPHDGAGGRLRVLIHGSGGYGDMIYLSTVVREIYDHFGGVDVFVVHEHPHVGVVYRDSPYVSGAIPLAWDRVRTLLHAVNSLDVFDLVAEVRYAVTYTVPPLSRLPEGFKRRAMYSSVDWQRYVRYDWPHLNHTLANEAVSRGLTKLDLVGQTSLLPIDRNSDLDLFIPEPIRAHPSLMGARFATVHHGADRTMSAKSGLQTKNLAGDAWGEVVAGLQRHGLKVVQLGENHETPLAGVDVDLRGRTSLLETAYVIKGAQVHVDTEGGLVHVARAVNTPSVVAFGPTPVGFFGYPQNRNLSPRLCGNCWWTTRRWAAACPRGLAHPECMASHDPSEMVAEALACASVRSAVEMSLEPYSEGAQLSTLLSDLAAEAPLSTAGGLVLISRGQDIAAVATALEGRAGTAQLLVHKDEFAAFRADDGISQRLRPYSDGNIPLRTGHYDWALAIGMDVRNPTGVGLMLDLSRCVREGGPCWVVADNGGNSLRVQDWVAHLLGACGQLQGGRFSVDLRASDGCLRQVAYQLLLRLVRKEVHQLTTEALADAEAE